MVSTAKVTLLFFFLTPGVALYSEEQLEPMLKIYL